MCASSKRRESSGISEHYYRAELWEGDEDGAVLFICRRNPIDVTLVSIRPHRPALFTIATSVGCFLELGGLLNEAVLFIVELLAAAANLAHEAAQQPPPKETTAFCSVHYCDWKGE